MSNESVVSIITPSFNQAQFLEETIQSVLHQDYPHIEYIVIDGGSTDGSVDIIRKYEPWLAYWVSEPDQGQADAINKGWSMARGEILAYLNSDDTYAPGAIAIAANWLDTNPEADIVYGDALLIDHNGKVIGEFLGEAFDYLGFVRTCRNVIPQPSAFLRRSVLSQAGLIDPTLQFVIDFEFWLRVGRCCKMLHKPGVLSNVRIQSASKTSRIKTVAAAEIIRVCQRLVGQPDLERDIQSIRAEAMGSAYAIAAGYTFAALLPQKTREYLWSAFRSDPRHVSREWVVKFILSMFGVRAMRYSRDLYQRWTGTILY